MSKRSWLLLTLAAAFAATLGACQATTLIPLASGLRRSGEVSFFCLDPDGKGVPLVECPRARPLTISSTNITGGQIVGNEGYDLYALVTQTATGEVAVVRLTGRDENGRTIARVQDVERSIPGPTPLRIGQRPTDIVTTPGGTASFVAVAELQKPGLFALPTSCVFAPGEDEEQRDLTTWPACSLPSAPGDLMLIVDGADSDGLVRRECGGAYAAASVVVAADSEVREANSRVECLADLSEERAPAGRQKLVVALPDEGKLVVIDAQGLLDRRQGSFDPCVIEAELPLDGTLPGTLSQPLPSSLSTADAPTKEYSFAGTLAPRPAGMALDADRLVVADQNTPLIHRVDVRDVCAMRELPPLVAASYLEPERVVTTSKVAISPVTTDGKQFVYAVDELGSRATDFAESLASLIAFDVSPTSPSVLPMVKEDAAYTPLEPPDRLVFAAPVKDVAFVQLDEPEVNAITGAGAFGVRCDPDPALGSDEPGVRHRPSDDFLSGASPFAFRGTFAYALLGNGQISLIDVEDLDAACRRPKTTNPDEEPDRFGCAGDDASVGFYTADRTATGNATVTDETSCRVVVPHRQRSGVLLRPASNSTTFTYVRSATPSLATFPRLIRDRRTLPIARTTGEGRKRPILLAADYLGPSGEVVDASVYVGSTLRAKDLAGDRRLELDPGLAEFPSVTLPNIEPRAYPTTETVTITYEGDLDGPHRTGNLVVDGEVAVLRDREALFCSAGVTSEEQATELGARKFRLSGGSRVKFAERHGDYFQISSALLPEDDEYWSSPSPECSARFDDLYAQCDSMFGAEVLLDAPTSRDYRILRAFQNHLEFEPRVPFDGWRDYLACCFPEPVNYFVRAGHHWVVRGSVTGLRHDVRAARVRSEYDDFACERDPEPLRAFERGRVFEISGRTCEDTNPEASTPCKLGPRTDDDVVCVTDPDRLPVDPSSREAVCIFDGLTKRFALYRGLEPSLRGMTFLFDVNGGFTPQSISLGSSTTITGTTTQPSVLPVSLAPIPTFSMMAAVDSQTRGLLLIDLRTATVTNSFN